jgi:hypothetical protein
MSKENTTLQAIYDTRRNFDIDSPQEGDELITPSTGESWRPGQPTGVEEPSIPLTESLESVDFTQSKPFQDIKALLEARIQEWTRESERLDKSQDYRSAHATMAIGAKQLLADVADYALEHQNRVRGATKDERVKLTPDANRLIDDLLASPEESADDPLPAATPQSNAEVEAIAKRRFIDSTGRKPMPELENTLRSLNFGLTPEGE